MRVRSNLVKDRKKPTPFCPVPSVKRNDGGFADGTPVSSEWERERIAELRKIEREIIRNKFQQDLV